MNGAVKARLLDLDHTWSRRLQISSQPGLLRTLEIFIAHSGDSWFVLIAIGLTWWLGDSEWKDLAVALATGVIVTALAVLVIKLIVRRERPAGEWGGIYRKTDPHSFPSGHAARAVMVAVTALGLAPAWLGIALCIWAPLVCLSRVVMGVHYLFDVLAGMLLGSAIGLVIVCLA